MMRLPAEILFHILLFLSPDELISLQRVSQQFLALINDRAFWRAKYAHSNLPRPPGPFSWQSTNFLRRTLVHSSQLEKNWTSEPIRIVCRYTRVLKRNDSAKWVCGRWLISSIDMEQLLSRDFYTGSEQVLYASSDRWIWSWDVASCMTSAQGHLLYVGVYTSYRRMELLEFQVDDDSGSLSATITLDVPIHGIGPNIAPRLKGGIVPFVFISADAYQKLADTLVYDTRTRRFYRFPLEHSPEPPGETDFERWLRHRYDEVVLTMTHIIVFRASKSYSIQAYTLPGDSETGQLRLSHETVLREYHKSWSLLQDTVVDAVSGSTSMTLLHASNSLSLSTWRLLCTNLTLPASSTGSRRVLPIVMESHIVFTLNHVPYGMGITLVQPTLNGLARGLCVLDRDANASTLYVRKFSVDATSTVGRCVGVVGDLCPLWVGAGMDLRWIGLPPLSFDGTRGTFYYTKDVAGGEHAKLATVVDIE